MHTVQGNQFTGVEFTQVLPEHRVKISMDGKDRWADNIFVVRPWRTLKCVEVYRKAYTPAPRRHSGQWEPTSRPTMTEYSTEP